jgi:hypothetical protein
MDGALLNAPRYQRADAVAPLSPWPAETIPGVVRRSRMPRAAMADHEERGPGVDEWVKDGEVETVFSTICLETWSRCL